MIITDNIGVCFQSTNTMTVCSQMYMRKFSLYQQMTNKKIDTDEIQMNGKHNLGAHGHSELNKKST